MIVELDKLTGDAEKFDLLLKAEDIELDRPDVEIQGDVSLRGEVIKRSAQIDVAGTIAFSADVGCTRCLKPVRQAFLFNFENVFVEPENFSAEKEKELGMADMETDILPGNRLDLNAITREQILLNLPDQVLCTEQCKGICAKCGEDRNLVDCNCDSSEIDPRWAALKDMK